MLIDLEKGPGLSGQCCVASVEPFQEAWGLASHDLPGSRRRDLTFIMRALEGEDLTDSRVLAPGKRMLSIPSQEYTLGIRLLGFS